MLFRSDERDLGALSRKLERSGAADAASGAGEQDERHLGGLYLHPDISPSDPPTQRDRELGDVAQHRTRLLAAPPAPAAPFAVTSRSGSSGA